MAQRAGIVAVIALAGAIGISAAVGGAAARGQAEEVGGRPVPAEASAPAVSGAWAAAAEAEKLLGFAADEKVPAALQFKLDKKLWAGWEENEAEEIRAELDSLGHRAIATAQVRAGKAEARGWIITHRQGNTYACVVVPNLGLLAHRLALVPGATAERDLLFVEWGIPDGAGEGRPRVSAYRRGDWSIAR